MTLFFSGEGWKAFTACMIAFTTKLDHVIQQQVHICKHSDVNMNPRFRTSSLQQSTMVALKNLENPLDKLGWHGLLFIATSHVSIPMWRILKVFLDIPRPFGQVWSLPVSSSRALRSGGGKFACSFCGCWGWSLDAVWPHFWIELW